MQIQINSGHNIDVNQELVAQVTDVVENALDRFADQITRVEVHLSDENSDKKVGRDAMRCVMEARLEGRQPIAVTENAMTLDEAVDGAADKLTRKVDSIIGRLREHHNHRGQNEPLAFDAETEEEAEPDTRG